MKRMTFLTNNLIACITAVCGGVVTSIFGLSSGLLAALVIVLVLDFVTGIIAAKMRGEKIESRIMRRKAVHLLSVFITLGCISLLLWVSNQLGVAIEGTSSAIIFDTTFLLFFAPEMWSVFENLQSMGVKIPTQVFDVLKKLSIKADKK